MEEANAAKVALNIEFKQNPKSHILEVLEIIYVNGDIALNPKKMTIYHSKLKETKENFAKPSPDHAIHEVREEKVL